MKKKILSIVIALALVLTLLPVSALAAENIDISNWTVLTGSTTGKTIGSSGTTSYYKIETNTTFTNSAVGGSGLTIADGATVYIYIPENVTLTCTGADGENTVGGGAGIELPENATLCLLGEGTVNATGGDAGNGGNGSDAGASNVLNPNGEIVPVGLHWNDSLRSGDGGSGGNGGGGAGAGIGTAGASGGNGGAGGEGVLSKKIISSSPIISSGVFDGKDGLSGEASKTADLMGSLCISDAIIVNAIGGNAGTGGMHGTAGSSQMPVATSGSDTWVFQFGSSGGGGGGGGGYAAADIGTGGSSGAGGGGGGSGSVGYLGYNSHLDGWNPATGNAAGGIGGFGGSNGENGDGTKTTANGREPTAAVTGGAGGASGASGANGAPEGYDYHSLYTTDNIIENYETDFDVLATVALVGASDYADITYYVSIAWSVDTSGIEFENGALYEWSTTELKYVPVADETVQLLGDNASVDMEITVTNRSNAAVSYGVSFDDTSATTGLTTSESIKDDSVNGASGTIATADQNGAATLAPGSGHVYSIDGALIDAKGNAEQSAVYSATVTVTGVTDGVIIGKDADLTLGTYTVTLGAA